MEQIQFRGIIQCAAVITGTHKEFESFMCFFAHKSGVNRAIWLKGINC